MVTSVIINKASKSTWELTVNKNVTLLLVFTHNDAELLQGQPDHLIG